MNSLRVTIRIQNQQVRIFSKYSNISEEAGIQNNIKQNHTGEKNIYGEKGLDRFTKPVIM